MAPGRSVLRLAIVTNGQAYLRFGDLAYVLASPIAERFDRLFGTKLAQCEGCKRRRAMLNKVSRKLR